MAADAESAETAETDTADAETANVATMDELPEPVRKSMEAARKGERAAERRAKEAEARIKQFEDRDKSETEKAAEKARELETTNGGLSAENLRLRVALDKQLPAELIDRLKGSSREEIEADADALMQLVGAARTTTTSFDGGVRQDAPTQDMNTLLREAAGRT